MLDVVIGYYRCNNYIAKSFQPIKEHYLSFVVFCLLFSIIVDPQQQISHSITTQSNNINSKQLSQSQVDSWVIKQFWCECLWCHAQALTQIKLYCPRNYYNDNKATSLFVSLWWFSIWFAFNHNAKWRNILDIIKWFSYHE